MTRQEVHSKVVEIVAQQQGSTTGFASQNVNAKDLQEAFGVTSLDVVAIQVSMEEYFGLKFATGVNDRGPIDAAWDAAKSVEDLVELTLRFRG